MNIKISPPYSENFSILNLIRLTSPTLPIGAFSYSQGLEYAVGTGWVDNASSVSGWVQGLLKHSLMYLDVPILGRFYQSWKNNHMEKVLYWNEYLLASRDSYELQEEDLQLGKALARLLVDLDLGEAEPFSRSPNSCFLNLYALAATRWNISLNDAAIGFLWMWAENQVIGAIKLVPLGQTAGQKILSQIIELIPEVVARGLLLEDEDIGFTAPGQGIASTLHETQYTRLFRS